MPNHVLVSRDALGSLLRKTWDMFGLLAEESGYTETNLESGSELVTLAVQAGLPIPGPMAPGHVPPAPPAYRFRGGTPVGPVYRVDGDCRLRCELDAKVVFPTKAQAVAATQRITGTQMYHYLGACGHWHLTRQPQTNRK